MLSKEDKTRFIRALLDGGFEQAFGTLYNPDQDAYCATGVFCKSAPGVEAHARAYGISFGMGKKDPPKSKLLSPGIQKAFGVTGNMHFYVRRVDAPQWLQNTVPVRGRKDIEWISGTITGLNDAGATFEQIAELVDVADFPSQGEWMEWNHSEHGMHSSSLETVTAV